MSRVCQVTGKRRLMGNLVSHSNRKTKHAQQPNLIKKRLYISEENRYITVRLSARALRTISKKGVLQVLKKNGVKL